VHSGYARSVADGPAGGRPVLILRVRRFFCGNPVCAAGTFAEQGGRADRPLSAAQPAAAGFTGPDRAGAGRPGRARPTGVLGAPVHRTTLLRLIAALAEPGIGGAPEVTGVDDFALRKGRVANCRSDTFPNWTFCARSGPA
jgi:hypothetical protein